MKQGFIRRDETEAILKVTGMSRSVLTEESSIKASIFKVLIDQQMCVTVNAASMQFDKIPVLDSRNGCNLCHELSFPLMR